MQLLKLINDSEIPLSKYHFYFFFFLIIKIQFLSAFKHSTPPKSIKVVFEQKKISFVGL